MLKAELRVISGKQLGTLIPLQQAKFLVGREQDCDLRPNSEMVSRHHCVFSVDDYTVRVRDLGSTNGTLVNGERSRSTVVLKPGDRVTIGKLEFVVVINGDAGTALDDTVFASTSDTVLSTGNPQASTGPTAPPAANNATPNTSATLSDSALEDLLEQAPGENPSATLVDFTVPALEEQNSPPTAPIEGDTQYIAPLTSVPQMPVGYPTQGYPQQGYPQQGFPPQGQPQYAPQPGMPQQGAYPPPGYPQMPQGYPPGYPYPYGGYPPPQYYPYPPQQQPVAPPPPAATPPAVETPTAAKPAPGDDKLDIRLPDPKTTGAKAPEPPPPPKEGEVAPAKGAHIPTAASDIIAQYLGRRPNSNK
ncbi:MAG: FHA domain-containing protein [Planctomycetaceae bacterium]